jgi:hypothetical protein
MTIDPYTYTPFTPETFPTLCLAARGQAPGQPNAAAYEREQARAKALAERPRSTPHKKLVKAICAALSETYHGQIRIERRNVGFGQFKSRRTGQMVRVNYGQPGEADIRVTLKGRAIALEVKAPETGDVQRESQARWETRWIRAGGYYSVVHSVEEALAAVKKAIAP